MSGETGGYRRFRFDAGMVYELIVLDSKINNNDFIIGGRDPRIVIGS